MAKKKQPVHNMHPGNTTESGGMEWICDICERVVIIWVYPLTVAVLKPGDENARHVKQFAFTNGSLEPYEEYFKTHPLRLDQ